MISPRTVALPYALATEVATYSGDMHGRMPTAGRPARVGALVLVASAIAMPMPAKAVDGCLVLLCFAAPSWRAIPQCVPPIRQVLRDLARGRAFPTCGMAGRGNNATLSWASAPTNCPPQYTHEYIGDAGPTYGCDFSGAIAVNIEGRLWARTWWSMEGDSVTEFTDAAKRGLG